MQINEHLAQACLHAGNKHPGSDPEPLGADSPAPRPLGYPTHSSSYKPCVSSPVLGSAQVPQVHCPHLPDPGS